MNLAAQLKQIKAMPDGDNKYDKLVTLSLKAMPRGSIQSEARSELDRLSKAGYNSPIVKRANAAVGQGTYQTIMTGSDGKKRPPVKWGTREQAEAAKRNAELLGFESEIQEIKPKKVKEKKAMVGKKIRNKKLSPEVQKADELRQKALAAASEATRINKQSLKEFAEAKTQEAKQAVRDKYSSLREKTKFNCSKAYIEYDTYLRDTFGVSNAYTETNEKFFKTDEGFIDFLEKRSRSKAKNKPKGTSSVLRAVAKKSEKTLRPNPFEGADDIYTTKNKIAVTRTKNKRTKRGYTKTTQTKYYEQNDSNLKLLKKAQGDAVRSGRKGTQIKKL